MSQFSRLKYLAAVPALWLFPQLASAQTPTLFYSFEGGTLNNTGSLGGAGTPVNFNANEFVAGAPGSSTPGGGLRLDQDGAADANTGEFFLTNQSATAIGLNGAPYTSSAWVRLDSGGGDSMVFGQQAQPFLHEGFRDNGGTKIHMGHWGQDTTSSINVSTGQWNHYAWTQLTPATFGAGAPANAQFIYQNGYIVATSGSGPLANAGNVVIGSSGNGGGLLGTLDDVATYAAPLRPNQVQYLAAGGSPLTLPAAEGYLPAVLPGPTGTDGVFGILEVRGNAGMNHIDAAVSALRPGNPTQSNATTGTSAFVNFVDPDTNATAGTFGGETPFLTNVGGVDDNNIALVAKGRINVPSAGTYTFRVRGDDGFALRVQGQNWSGVSGGGGIDPLNPQTMYFAGGTGDSDTRASLNLTPGNYELEFVGFEGGGGAHQELMVSKNGGPFSLVGVTATTIHCPGVTSTGWTVTTSAPGGTAVNNIADARNDLTNFPGASATGVASINYNDPQSGGPGSIVGDIPFPNDTGIDDDNFALKATGTLVIPTPGTYRFGFQGDDGGYLRIAGTSGWSIVETAVGGYVADQNGVANAGGDTLWADVQTGNSRTIGQINLAAGSYPIEGFFFELGGGAYFEIFGAEVVPGAEVTYKLLANDNGVNTLNLAGLALVPEPSSSLLLLLGAGFFLRRRRQA